jgi:hypothetical protein
MTRQSTSRILQAFLILISTPVWSQATAPLTQVVQRISPVETLGANPSGVPRLPGSTVVFQATVSGVAVAAPTGTLHFVLTDTKGAVVATGDSPIVAGVASWTATPCKGVYTVSAAYPGDLNYLPQSAALAPQNPAEDFNAAEHKHVHYREREHAPKRGLDHPNFTGRLHSSSRGVVVLIRIWDAKTTKAPKTRSGRCPFVLLLIRDDWLWFWWECCLEPSHSKSELPGDRYRHFGQHHSYPDSHRGSSINEGLEPLSRIYIWVTRLTRRRHPKVFRLISTLLVTHFQPESRKSITSMLFTAS